MDMIMKTLPSKKFLGLIFLLVGLGLTSACGSGAPEVSEEEITAVYNAVEWNYYYAQSENLKGYMLTLHDNAPGRSQTETMMRTAMRDFDLEYRILEWELLSIDSNSAKVRVLQLTRKLNGDEPFRDNRIEIVHTLRKSDNGEWKIFSSDAKDVEYLN